MVGGLRWGRGEQRKPFPWVAHAVSLFVWAWQTNTTQHPLQWYYCIALSLKVPRMTTLSTMATSMQTPTRRRQPSSVLRVSTPGSFLHCIAQARSRRGIECVCYFRSTLLSQKHFLLTQPLPPNNPSDPGADVVCSTLKPSLKLFLWLPLYPSRAASQNIKKLAPHDTPRASMHRSLAQQTLQNYIQLRNYSS